MTNTTCNLELISQDNFVNNGQLFNDRDLADHLCRVWDDMEIRQMLTDEPKDTSFQIALYAYASNVAEDEAGKGLNSEQLAQLTAAHRASPRAASS